MMTLSHVNDLFGRRKRFTPVCLFGAPDPVETEKLYEEAFMVERDNFLKRYSFDVYTGEQLLQPGDLKWEVTRCDEICSEVERSGEGRLTAGDEEATSTTSPEGRIQDTYAEVNASSPIGSRTGRAVQYSPYHKKQKLTDYWPAKKASSKGLKKNRQTKKPEDKLGHPNHTFSQRESSNVTM